MRRLGKGIAFTVRFILARVNLTQQYMQKLKNDDTRVKVRR